METSQQSLEELEMHGDFIRRHIGPDRHQVAEMVDYLGLNSLEEIIDRAEGKSKETVETILREFRDDTEDEDDDDGE